MCSNSATYKVTSPSHIDSVANLKVADRAKTKNYQFLFRLPIDEILLKGKAPTLFIR